MRICFSRQYILPLYMLPVPLVWNTEEGGRDWELKEYDDGASCLNWVKEGPRIVRSTRRLWREREREACDHVHSHSIPHVHVATLLYRTISPPALHAPILVLLEAVMLVSREAWLRWCTRFAPTIDENVNKRVSIIVNSLFSNRPSYLWSGQV